MTDVTAFLWSMLCALLGHVEHHDFYTRHDPEHEVLVDRTSCGRCGLLVSKTDRLRLERMDGF
ncbi:hypothetical protein [Microbacterium maritypicum]|uniref:hypothetical protein n=1 Tax=Microbacterium maritypicum TaxID=33918 RepID=UPI0037FECC66